MSKGPRDHAPVMLAEFELDGDQLRARWSDEDMKESLEQEGVAVVTGVFYPKDGKAFFDALPTAINHLSFFYIEDVA